MTPRCDALLTYAWCRSSYTALRSLSRLGLRVAVADTGRVGMSQWSKHASFVGQYAPPLTQPEEFVDDIVLLLEQTGARFLLPGHDETEILAQSRQKLPPGVILPVAEHASIQLANDKARMAQLAAQVGLPVPAVVAWDSVAGLSNQLGGASGPFVVKLRRGNSAKGVFYPTSAPEVVELCETLCEQYELTPDRQPVVQERVQGEGWGVSCLYWEGAHIASFTHRRLREKTATGGTSTLRMSVRNPLLEQFAHELLDRMNWHGLAMVEFKYDSDSNEGWFIEINPRLWGSIHLAVASGVDFPALLYQASTQGPETAQRAAGPQSEGLVARWYLGDMIVAVGELGRFRPLRAIKVLLPGGSDTVDDWHRDDPKAFFGQAAYYFSTFVKSKSLNPVQEGMLG